MARNVKGPALFLAQFAGDTAPFITKEFASWQSREKRMAV